MTIKEFTECTLAEQYRYLVRKGKHLLTRGAGNYYLHLYSLDHFYAEVWVDTRGFRVARIISLLELSSMSVPEEEVRV
jgi:hypothetical protein